MDETAQRVSELERRVAELENEMDLPRAMKAAIGADAVAREQAAGGFELSPRGRQLAAEVVKDCARLLVELKALQVRYWELEAEVDKSSEEQLRRSPQLPWTLGALVDAWCENKDYATAAEAMGDLECFAGEILSERRPDA